MKTGLAITTHSTPDSPRTTKRLEELLVSLEATNLPDVVVVVDDGSDNERHIQYLSQLESDFVVVRRPVNGGIAKAKNTCIKALLERGVEFGFLADDDLAFHPGWLEAYTSAHHNSGIHHFSWAMDTDKLHNNPMVKELQYINNTPIHKTSHVNGALLTFTPQLIQAIGGFPLLPYKWGHEHTSFTIRAVSQGFAPFYCDVPLSNLYVSLNRYSQESTTPDHLKQLWYPLNLRAIMKANKKVYHPLEE